MFIVHNRALITAPLVPYLHTVPISLSFLRNSSFSCLSTSSSLLGATNLYSCPTDVFSSFALVRQEFLNWLLASRRMLSKSKCSQPNLLPKKHARTRPNCLYGCGQKRSTLDTVLHLASCKERCQSRWTPFRELGAELAFSIIASNNSTLLLSQFTVEPP